MIRTRTPYNGWGIIFKFNAAMITTMRQVKEMMTTSMVSEGENYLYTKSCIPSVCQKFSWL